MKKINIYIDSTISIGRACYVFSYQFRKINEFFKESKIYFIVNDITDADYVIVLSCVVSNVFLDKSINDLKNYRAQHPDKKYISYGCYTKYSNLEDSDKIYYIDHDNTDKFNTIFDLDSSLPLFSEVNDIAVDNDEEFYLDKKNELIVIGHGCAWDCSYCNHKYTKKLKSFSEGYIFKNIELRLAKGITHFRITSDDVTSYGVDKGNNFSYIELVKKILNKYPNVTISLGPLFPNFLNKFDDLYEILKTGRVIELFIAVEHISQDILKKMNRNYDIDLALENIYKIKTTFPKIKISTHIIYGFPGETMDDFKKLFMVHKYFDQVQFFKLSKSRRVKEKLGENVEVGRYMNKKEEILFKYYQKKEGFKLFLNHRIVLVRDTFIANDSDLNEGTF